MPKTPKPIAYILERKNFFGLSFIVDERVLIPRPETEMMVERALKILKTKPHYVIDVGTGSGCIAISVAKNSPETLITAIDISADALEVAKQNAKRHKVEINFVHSDLLESVTLPKTDLPFLFLMNLPYLSDTHWDEAQESVKQFEPTIALRGGKNGLDIYRKIFKQIKHLVHPSTLLCEAHDDQMKALAQLVKNEKTHNDFSGQKRVIECTGNF